jgi:hypothetical protein
MTNGRPNDHYNSRSVVGQAAPTASDTSLPSAVSACVSYTAHQQQRTIRRLAIEVRQASLHADATQHTHIVRLILAVRQGHIAANDALQAVVALRDQQHPNRHAA